MVVKVLQNVGPQEVTRGEKAQQQADELVREVVNAKSRLLQSPGEKNLQLLSQRPNQGIPTQTLTRPDQVVMVPYQTIILWLSWESTMLLKERDLGFMRPCL